MKTKNLPCFNMQTASAPAVNFKTASVYISKIFTASVTVKVKLFLTSVFLSASIFAQQQQLPDTSPIEWTENYFERNSRLITEFLDREIGESESRRAQYWNRDFSSRDAYQKSVEKNRERLKFIIGVRDRRIEFESPELICTLDVPPSVAENATHTVRAIRWKVFDGFSAEGLLVSPKSARAKKTVIHLPLAGTSPEELLSGGDELLKTDWFAPPSEDEQMIVPVIVSRNLGQYKRVQLPYREFIYRQAYQLGRHIIGYEVQEILALVDWLKKTPDMRVTVQGQGDGGLLALYAAAVDTRIDGALVVDYFDRRDRLCDEPIDRNVFSLLREFGDAEIAGLICPRPLTVALHSAPELELPFNRPWNSKYGGAPGTLKKLNPESVEAEVERAKKITEPLGVDWISIKELKAKPGGFNTANFSIVRGILSEQHIVRGMENHTQQLLGNSVFTRRDFWKKLNTSSPEKIAETVEWYRDYFSKNVVGEFEEPLLPLNPRTRFFRDCETYTIYEVELDVYKDLTAFGFLLIPKTLRDGQKLPAIVGQHGLEVDAKMHIIEFDPKKDTGHAMITKLCNGGYVTFAPQGIFKLSHKFRFNQRQLNSLGRNLFAVMTAQQKQIVKFLQTLSFVDGDRIGFYGCSYGGTTAMFVPPLIPDYGAVVCSANFNYWNDKVAGTLLPQSYMFDWQYEIFDFDLANTFDHSDMTRLIAPRPFMVERGHDDGVALDEYVAFEFGKVRYYYDMHLKMPERAEILFLPDGHLPYVTPVLPFLDKWLKK
ncbi:MAG: acetylxylan esterase [Bacteroidales bacterium]|jgi:cephalosporin-C deacetylase-like acetyl esterase|nr:acetylxylan esterase [Bacteroidales bacterium]